LSHWLSVYLSVAALVFAVATAGMLSDPVPLDERGPYYHLRVVATALLAAALWPALLALALVVWLSG
jgi:hypothetical protein